MSNQQHTPTPWFQSHREGKDGGYRTEIYDTTGETIATLTWYAMPKNKDGAIGTYREANAKRIISCVNAMAGIEDPEKFVKIALDIKTNPKRFIDNSPSGRQKMWLRMIEQHEDLRKYKTACEGINPDNPMAVAENLIEVKEYLEYMKDFAPDDSYMVSKAIELLTKIQSK